MRFAQRRSKASTPAVRRSGRELDVTPADHFVIKNCYSAFISGSSQLERLLRSLGIDTVLIAGTKTNVCCEATARDAMMLDFRLCCCPIVAPPFQTTSIAQPSRTSSNNSAT